MYIIKNALRSITRIKGRSILIGILVVIIATSSCVALAIKNSAVELVESYKTSNQIEAKLTLNRSSMRNDMMKNRNSTDNKELTPDKFMDNVQKLDVDTIKNYANSEYVNSYRFNIKTNLNSSNITKVSSDNFNNNQSERKDFMKEPNNTLSGDFEVVGYSDINAMSEFINSTYKITEGSVFDFNTENNECIISEELAQSNELSIGDTIVLVNPNDESKSEEFIITGFYSDSSENEEFSMFSQSANRIITKYISLNNFVNNNSTDEANIALQVDATYTLVNEQSIDKFSEELKTKGLSEYYTISTNIDSINENVKPIENLNTFATIFLIVVLIVGATILIIVNMINIRERKYEIGVLRAIGMKKGKVLLQFITESFIITFISIIIGTGIGSLLTVPVANKLLKSEIESTQQNNEKIESNFGMNFDKPMGQMNNMPQQRGDIRNTFNMDSQANYIDKINAVIDVKTILQLLLIGILLTIISSSMSMIFVFRYTPLKILSNRT